MIRYKMRNINIKSTARLSRKTNRCQQVLGAALEAADEIDLRSICILSFTNVRFEVDPTTPHTRLVESKLWVLVNPAARPPAAATGEHKVSSEGGRRTWQPLRQHRGALQVT
jgi:hypothetical protein